MLIELQKRPFSRPLFCWILGIYLYVFFPYHWTVSILILALLLILVFSCTKNTQGYNNRWLWGLVFSFSVIVLAVLMCAHRDLMESYANADHSLLNWANTVRERLFAQLERLQLTVPGRDVLEAILLGNAHSIDKEVRQQFSVTGVAHILSVSGFHVAVVCGFVRFLLSPFPSYGFFKWIKYGLTLCLLWIFTLITGLAVPSVRAALMLSFFLTGRTICRTTDSYNTLAASAFFMLVYNPFNLFDIGFQLSYLAVWFILLLQPFLNNLIVLRNPLLAQPYHWITIAVAAQVGTAFLCLYYFGQFPALFLLANLPFSFITTLLIPAGLVYLFLPDSLSGTGLLAICIEKMTGFLLYIVEAFSSYSWAAFIIPFDIFDVLLGYAFLFLFVLFVYRKRPVFLILSLSVLTSFLIKILLESLWLPAI
ncbi:MAG: ComEC/Rec2 family competence protein [Massilibacteroides sp.]|nr:ComEC/Rec2 family competence protein [Massilibacteroides sp.]MDD3063562.1 ComEC/Rec2 family competence protein [Massilibacteroides sp.]MDD4114234.1 ComEC/Rec2 family competence protein [Massilibacteroides sp.]MDD4661049.1 ComEC/Rec2 family competence protein [Massilibacteroides sp.]